VSNWAEVARALLQRAQREAVGGAPDPSLRAVLEEIAGHGPIPPAWQEADLAAPLLPIIPITFAKEGRVFRFFSTVTVLGTPIDVTAQEIRIECFHPADAETRAYR
jgi:hypothetical protein